MTPLLEDPRIRQQWNHIFQNAESATETAAENIWTFQHHYIHPCFESITHGIKQCAGHCFHDREERARRRLRGRTEANFDFYDDWDQDDSPQNQGLLGGWRNDEFERLLTGNVSHSGRAEGINQPPRRKRGMSYGTRGLRKNLEPDPTVIPSTSALGFLGRLPFKIGSTLRYKPSAADLQDHPGKMRSDFWQDSEREPLMGNEDYDQERPKSKGHKRTRCSTISSGETSDSFRSRRDLFSSDGEDDAVQLSDEFAMALGRRNTSPGKDNQSSRQTSINAVITAPKVNSPASVASQSPSHTKLCLRERRASSTNSRADIPSMKDPQKS
ncbi:hypothetical protein K3495_g12368 [Podosphaera aphanis]|nr:hypothetical protein K3495_g12368 [Podosphaera aphanis]